MSAKEKESVEHTRGDFTSLQSSLLRALSRIGTKNGHAPPAGVCHTAEQLHLLYVFNTARKYFDGAYKGIINQIKKDHDEIIEATEPGTHRTILDADGYTLVLNKKNPPRKLNMAKFREALREAGVAPSTIVAAEEAAQDVGTSAKEFTVSFY